MKPPPAIPADALLSAWLLLTLILLVHLGASLMTRKIFTVAAIAVAGLMLSGCLGATGALSAGDGHASVLGNLQGCTRHYEGAIGAGVTGSFRIDCTPQTPAAPAEAPAT